MALATRPGQRGDAAPVRVDAVTGKVEEADVARCSTQFRQKCGPPRLAGIEPT
jgi:hypothetical protein